MPASNILLNVPEPLSITTVEESERKTSPGDPLLKEGTPVPEPMMINWSISNSPKKNASKLTRNGEKSTLRLAGLILRVCLGQKSWTCSGLTLSGDSLPPPPKGGERDPPQGRF